MGNCRNGAGNQSSMFGGYTINNPNGSCMASLGLWPPTSGGPFLWYSPQATGAYGSPTIVGSSSVGNLIGQWTQSDNSNSNCLLLGNSQPTRYMLGISRDCGWADALAFSYDGSSAYNLGLWVYGNFISFPIGARRTFQSFPTASTRRACAAGPRRTAT